MEQLFAFVRSGIVGEGRAARTPYGLRRLTYVDHAASGRLYGPDEDYLRSEVLPVYANTHTETTATGAQTTAFREGARRVIREATGCGESDVVIFAGDAATAAIHTLIGCMGLAIPCCLKDAYGLGIPEADRPVVFIGSYEHHSVEIAFREAEVIVETVRECGNGGIDLDHLAELLAQYRGRRAMIGCFSAASNVTGRITNVNAVARTMHEAGGVVFFDYAAAGPYVELDMNPSEPGAYKDAAFLSMHKFTGGPGAPGVLLAKRGLFQNRVPSVPGGGTVASVTPVGHRYLSDIEHREEGGTPNILGSIRAGLAMQLKQSMPPGAILAHEMHFADQMIAALRMTPGVEVLGDLDEPRLGIVSFVVHATFSTGGGKVVELPDGLVAQTACASVQVTKCLHHNFVVALLNDLFGIQARGGNSCAAPYAHRLLRVSVGDEEAIDACVAEGWHGCKPGWTRISYGWYDSDETLAFVIAAVQFIASHGWRFLADYDFNPETGTWRHRAGGVDLLRLGETSNAVVLPEDVRGDYLRVAHKLATAPHAEVAFEPTPFEGLRWFWLPGEIRG